MQQTIRNQMVTMAAAVFIGAVVVSQAVAATVPFTEEFTVDSANWRNSDRVTPLDEGNAAVLATTVVLTFEGVDDAPRFREKENGA